MVLWKKFAATAAAGMLVLGVAGCSADNGEYPSKSIEFLVPYPAGGSTDTAARAFAAALEDEIGESVLVVNRGGAGTSIGMTEAAQQEADGHQIVYTSGSSFITVPLLQDVSYTAEDFVAVSPLIDRSYIVVAPADSKFQSLSDVTNHEDRYTYSTFGNGHLTHIAMANYVHESGTEGAPVPFNSTQEALQAVMNGQVDLAFVEPNFAAPFIKDGKLVALASTSAEPTKYMPDVPTFGDLGFKSASNIVGRSIVATNAGVPEDRLEILRTAAMNAYNSDEYQEFIATNYGEETPFAEGNGFFDEFLPEYSERFAVDAERMGLTK